MMTEQAKIEVRDNPSDQRYDVFVDGSLAGSTFYRTEPDLVIFTHTEIDPAYEGRGVGSALARAALDDVRSQGKHVIPQCPFIAGYIRRHDEYVDLVDERFRGRFVRSNT
jgi:predicted GNAT family acetyltransferase